MSVAAGARDEGKWNLTIKAEYLARYTIEITANEKVFAPQYYEAVTRDIIESAKNVYLGIREANDVSVRVGTVFQLEDYRERNRLQREAFRSCKRLLYLIDIAHRVFHLSSKRVKHWAQLTINIKNRLHGWMDDDTRRYLPAM